MGLVRRERSTDDERALDLVVTDAGRAMRASAVGIPAAMVAGLGLTLEQVEQIRSAAQLLITAAAPTPA
jgi:DNA-binding MarR family transcriptional regulator